MIFDRSIRGLSFFLLSRGSTRKKEKKREKKKKGLLPRDEWSRSIRYRIDSFLFARFEIYFCSSFTILGYFSLYFIIFIYGSWSRKDICARKVVVVVRILFAIIISIIKEIRRKLSDLISLRFNRGKWVAEIFSQEKRKERKKREEGRKAKAEETNYPILRLRLSREKKQERGAKSRERTELSVTVVRRDRANHPNSRRNF